MIRKAALLLFCTVSKGRFPGKRICGLFIKYSQLYGMIKKKEGGELKKLWSMLLVVCLLLSGCGTDISASMPEEQVMSCSALMEELLAAADVACDKTESYGEKNYELYFLYWYDMPIQFVADGSISYVTAGDNADEISILYPESGVTYETVKKALTRRIDRQVEHYTGLHDAQAARYADARVVECEGFLLFVVAENADEIIAEFEEILTEESGKV